MQMMTWLKFTRCKNDVNHVMNLCCLVCQEFNNIVERHSTDPVLFVIQA